MKEIAALIMIAIMVMLSLGAVGAMASDAQTLNLHFKSQTVGERLADLEYNRKPLDLEMLKLERQMDFIFAQYSDDPARMSDPVLNELITVQKRYASGKQTIIDGLKLVYLPTYQSKQIPINKSLEAAVTNATKNCRMFDRLASKCLDEREILVYQVHYLRLKIEGLNTTEASVTSQINSLIAQENNSMFL